MISRLPPVASLRLFVCQPSAGPREKLLCRKAGRGKAGPGPEGGQARLGQEEGGPIAPPPSDCGRALTQGPARHRPGGGSSLEGRRPRLPPAGPGSLLTTRSALSAKPGTKSYSLLHRGCWRQGGQPGSTGASQRGPRAALESLAVSGVEEHSLGCEAGVEQKDVTIQAPR